MQGIEKIPDPNNKKLEHDVFHQMGSILKEFEPAKPETSKNVLRTVGFEDAVKELMDLLKNKR